MRDDIFKFWSNLKRGEKIHPADRKILDHVAHQFRLEYLPKPYEGPLKTAKVVLLFLNPGLSESESTDAGTAEHRRRSWAQLSGESNLPTAQEHASTYKWIRPITWRFGDYDQIRRSVAVLDLCAYHSKNFRDWPMLAALPSSRACLDWAQNVLFPQAVAGQRVVVCMRSPRWWGLRNGKTYGKALFAPEVTQRGYLKASSRDRVLHIVHKALAVAKAAEQ